MLGVSLYSGTGRVPILPPKNVIHPINCIALHRGKYMPVDALGHIDIGMAKNVLGDFRVNPYTQQDGRCVFTPNV